MSAVRVCDVCGKVGDSMAFKVTENASGEVWEACNVTCYLKGHKDREAAK
ncbi:hypothetical protein ABC337_15315 [Arthrobacter sp. 1P04PC]